MSGTSLSKRPSTARMSSITSARKTLRVRLQVLIDAEREGLNLGPSWNGNSPPWNLRGHAIGWESTADLLNTSACWAGDQGAVQMTEELRVNLRSVAPAFAEMKGRAHDASYPNRTSLNKRLTCLGDFIKVMSTHISDAYSFASNELQVDDLALSNRVFHAAIYNRCFVGPNARVLIEMANLAAWNIVTMLGDTT